MQFLERQFHLSKRNTTAKTEILAGITTFLAMAFNLGLTPSVLSAAGMKEEPVFLSTAISSMIACILMGLLANYPVALSTGISGNVLLAYTICGAMGFSWQAGLAAVLISGIIFVIISVTDIRRKFIDAIPPSLKLAIGAGIGFFVAFLGLKNAGIVIASESTFVTLGNLADPTVLLSIIGIIITIICVVRKIPAAVFVGLILTALIGLILGFLGFDNMPQFNGIFTLNFDFSGVGAFTSGFEELFNRPIETLMVIFSLLFINFFETAGTLMAIGQEVGLINENGQLENAQQAFLADSLGTCIGSILGVSSVISFVESSTGVGVGGKTGLTAVTTGILFFFSIFISPLILGLITSAVTAPALIIVGVMMAQQLKNIEWDDLLIAFPAFITIIGMVLTYSMADGMAFGFIVYGVTMLAAKKGKEVQPIIWLLLIFFIFYFAFPYVM